MSELYHHGILGQKWGIRRYQNRDGTLTPEGRARYRGDEGGDTTEKKDVRKMTDEELRTAINRFRMEQDYKTLMARYEQDRREEAERNKPLLVKAGKVFMQKLGEQRNVSNNKGPKGPGVGKQMVNKALTKLGDKYIDEVVNNIFKKTTGKDVKYENFTSKDYEKLFEIPYEKWTTEMKTKYNTYRKVTDTFDGYVSTNRPEWYDTYLMGRKPKKRSEPKKGSELWRDSLFDV